MKISLIFFILGWVTFLEGCFFLLPGIVGFCYGEITDAIVYLVCAAVCILVGLLTRLNKSRNSAFYTKEGFLSVVFSWLSMSLVGAIPFVITGDIPSYTDALFEIISGFTTTGSSILSNVEGLSHANLFWRSFSHWIGGMGVLVFVLAIFPMSGGSTMNLMKAESPGPVVGKLVPKMQQTASLLYVIYFIMTVAEIILLLLGGMPLFDSICHAFGTAGTGGFGIKNDSIAGYSTYLQVVITVFMVLFGVNFTFFYYILIRRARDAFHLEEVRWYFGIFVAAVLGITVSLTLRDGGFFRNLQQSAFQVASIMTTTGYATADFDAWPQFCRTLLVFLMFIGACAGSTGGGIKVSRILLYVKQVKKELSQQIHPRQISIVKLDGKSLEHSNIRSCNIYIMAYFIIFVVSTLLISFDGFDFTTNFTAVTATLNNIGPGLNAVGPTANFAEFSTLSKYVLMFNMLAGRLEVIPMLILFLPGTWRKV